MSSVVRTTPLHAAAVAFVAGAVALTLFGVYVVGDPIERAALGSLGYAVGTAVGVYIAVAGPDWG